MAPERAVPWEELAVFLTNISHCDIVQNANAERNLLLINGCKP